MRWQDPMILVLTACAGIVTCSSAWTDQTYLPSAWPRTPIRVEGTVLVDATGRQVFLRGVNVGNKSSAEHHVTWPQAEDYQTLRNKGLTAVRYLIFWSAVEPKPGTYDETYLDAVAQQVEIITNTGLFVILDAHQDLYSESIPGGNGSPPWAVARPDLPHRAPGGVWSLAYFTSPRLHAAWDAFWANAPGPEGVGLQDRFARAWQRVASRFREMPGVIGYDLLNEPMAGTAMRELGAVVLAALGSLAASEARLALPDLLVQTEALGYLPPEVLRVLDSPRHFRAFFGLLEPLIHRFEQGELAGMYERVIPAVRAGDPDRIIFLEPTAAVTPGSESGLPLPRAAAAGSTAYLPHWYDLVLDTPIACKASRTRLELALAARKREAEHLGLPLLIGEWGAFYNNPACAESARTMAELLASNTCGDFYWDLHRDLTQAAYQDAIFRPSPIAVNGRVKSIRLDYASGTFEMIWGSENPRRPASLVYIPLDWQPLHITLDDISVDPDETGLEQGYLTVPPQPSGLEGERRLAVKRRMD